MNTFTHLAGLCLAAVLLGCGDEPQAPAPAPSAGAQPPPPQTPAVQPQYTLDIAASGTDPRTYTVTWTARVNTGGWKMTTDKVLVEDSMGATTARIWATLEQPGPDEMVTQAIETLTGTHDAGARKINKAELSIRPTVRGRKTDTPEMYSIVKRAG